MSRYGKPLSDQDKLWWGVATPKEGTGSTLFHVDRYADYPHALAHASDVRVAVPSHAVGEDAPSTVVEALTCSSNQGETWYFTDLGWVVPT